MEDPMRSLRQLLDGIKECEIEYRVCTPDGQDMFSGLAFYKNGIISPGDGDSYGLDDYVDSWEWEGGILTVWYESKWIEG